MLDMPNKILQMCLETLEKAGTYIECGATKDIFIVKDNIGKIFSINKAGNFGTGVITIHTKPPVEYIGVRQLIEKVETMYNQAEDARKQVIKETKQSNVIVANFFRERLSR